MGFTVDITFHRAENIPVGDLKDLSSDAFILATVSTPGTSQQLFFRTPTKLRTLQPVWNAKWQIAGVPKEGFMLQMKVIDQDNTTRNDVLGRAMADFTVDALKGRKFRPGYEVKEMECKLMKRKGSVQAHVTTYIGSMISHRISRHGFVYVSVKVTGTDGGEDGALEPYTVGPRMFLPFQEIT